MSWQAVKLSDVCLTITDGAHKSPPSQESGFPMASVKDMTHWGIDLENCRLINQQDFDELCSSGCQPIKGDVLIAKDGNSCLQTVCVHGATIDMVLLSSVAILRPNPDKCDSKFLQYHLTNPYTKAALKNYISGVAIPRVVLRDFKTYQFSIPTIDVQQKIGSVLSEYDDLIENNRRRIQLLEESARLLYKEWFVHLRFPGHEHVNFTDGVPEGWRLGCLGDLVEVKSGFAFKSKDWLESGNPVIKIKNITGSGDIDFSGCQCVDDSIADKAVRFELFPGDMVIAMTGATVGKVGLMPRMGKKHFLNQRVGKYFPKINLNPIPFLFCISRSQYFNKSILNLAGGAAQPNVSGKQIESIEVIIPEMKILEWFNEYVNPMFTQREILLEQNDKLVQARDILLPRLMNAELAV